MIVLVVLDVRLPDGSGFDLLQELRSEGNLSVVLLTGLDIRNHRINGLEWGADDYICKPFDPRELVARIKSVLRRSNSEVPPAAAGTSGKPDGAGRVIGSLLAFDEYLLNPRLRSLSTQDGQPVRLTGGEFDLLLALAQAGNRPLSRDELLDRTRSREWSPFDRSVDVLIGRISRKIEKDPTRPELIKTVRHVGYLLTAPVREQVFTSDPVPHPKASSAST